MRNRLENWTWGDEIFVEQALNGSLMGYLRLIRLKIQILASFIHQQTFQMQNTSPSLFHAQNEKRWHIVKSTLIENLSKCHHVTDCRCRNFFKWGLMMSKRISCHGSVIKITSKMKFPKFHPRSCFRKYSFTSRSKPKPPVYLTKSSKWGSKIDWHPLGCTSNMFRISRASGFGSYKSFTPRDRTS